jgi:Ca2+-binding EF-hand superfamily protein
MFDEDGSKSIEKEEAIKFWGTNFAKINTEEFFKTVDVNNDGHVEEGEWVEFWEMVKGAGHDEEEILDEVSEIPNIIVDKIEE